MECSPISKFQSFKMIWSSSFENFYKKIYRSISKSSLWMARLSRISKYEIEIASGCLKNSFIIEAESEAVANLFLRSFQTAIEHINSKKFQFFNQLLKEKGKTPFFRRVAPYISPVQPFFGPINSRPLFFRAEKFVAKTSKTNQNITVFLICYLN